MAEKPIIEVKGEEIILQGQKMEEGKAYWFRFLGVDMMAIRKGETIEIYQEVNEG